MTKKKNSEKRCQRSGCKERRYARDLCKRHYTIVRRKEEERPVIDYKEWNPSEQNRKELLADMYDRIDKRNRAMKRIYGSYSA